MASLEEQENVRKPFNEAANVDLQKRLAAFELSKNEQEKVSDLQKERDGAKQQEKESFNNPEEFKKRFDEKYAELSQTNTPSPALTPQGERQNLPPHQLMQKAEVGIEQDHQKKLQGFDQNCNNGVNQVLDRASQDGRGPQQDTNQSQDQSRGQDPSQNRDR